MIITRLNNICNIIITLTVTPNHHEARTPAVALAKTRQHKNN